MYIGKSCNRKSLSSRVATHMFITQDPRRFATLEEISQSGLWIEILKKLDCQDLWKLSQTCKYFHCLLSTSDTIWHHLLRTRYAIDRASSQFGPSPARDDYIRLTSERQHAHKSMNCICKRRQNSMYHSSTKIGAQAYIVSTGGSRSVGIAITIIVDLLRSTS